MLKDKRGILLKETLYLVLSLVLIGGILFASFNAFNIIKLNKEKAQSEGSLERLDLVLNNLQKGWVDEYVGLAPIGWWLVSYSEKSLILECAGASCVCICKEEKCDDSDKRVCKIIDKNLIDRDSGENVKIQLVSSLTINSNGEFRAVVRSFPHKYKSFALSSKTYIDNYFSERDVSNFAGLGGCIKNISKESGIPEELIMAVMLHETGKGTSLKSQEVCSEGPSITSNALFGITGPLGTTEEGYCKWPTQECVKKGTVAPGDLYDTNEPCTSQCKEDESCEWRKRKFRAYDSKCESISDFARLMLKDPRYSGALEKYKRDLPKAAEEIGKVYASESEVWGRKVGEYIISIKRS